MVIISGSSLFKPCKAFCHSWVWEFIYWINPVEKKRKVKTSKLITHFMVLEFILLLKNNNFKYIQSWKKKQSAALVCEADLMTADLRVQCKEMEFLCHPALGDPALQSWACFGFSPSAKERLRRGRNQTNTAWRISRPREPPAVCNPEAKPWWVQRIFSLFCSQSSVGSWARAAQLCSTPEISAFSWALLPHTYQYSCLKESWPQLNPLKASKCWSPLMN